jgi:hypothetical protein
MTLKVLRANGAFESNGFGAVAVGTTPLADHSDATYIHGPSTGDILSLATVGLEPLGSYAATDPVSLHIRISLPASDVGEPTQGHGEVYLCANPDTSGEIASFSNGVTFSGFGFTIPTNDDGSPVDVVVPLYLHPFWGASMQDVFDLLTAGAYLELSYITNDNSSVGTSALDVKVYEAWIEVGTISPCFDTLAATWVGGDNTLEASSSIYGLLDTYTGPSVLDLTVDFTATSTTQDNISFVGVWGWDGSAATADLAVASPVSITADGNPHDYSHTFIGAELFDTWDAIKAALTSGAAVLRFEQGFTDAPIVIANATLRVGHKCYVLAPPLRRYPRSDGLGVGPKRHYPRSLSRRPGTF